MRERRKTWISIAVPVLCLAVDVLCLVACISAVGRPTRQRQKAAIAGVQLLCVAGVAVSMLAAAGWARRRRRWWHYLAVAAMVILTADPIDHLNNRWSGWLAS